MLNGRIDMRSDTVTQPTEGMRAAMAAAELGDDVFGDDPTVIRLQNRAAELLGKEAALLTPSGTMANLLAVMTQTRPGDSVILSDISHPYIFESGNAAQFAGVMFRPVAAEQGILTPEHVEAAAVLIDDAHFSQTRLVMVENTMNLGGGVAYPEETVAAVSAAAHGLGMRVHMDGARLFNACAATGTAPAAYARHADTVSFCLSKGLGCPVGSLLAGDRETISRAHRYRKGLGGGMRQAGVIAAAGFYALENHVDRLVDDHRRAAAFRSGVARIPGIRLVRPGTTNLVYFEVDDALRFVANLADRNVFCLPEGPKLVRAAFHLHLTDEDVTQAVAACEAAR